MRSLFLLLAVTSAVGPIQKVVQLLEDLKAKVIADGEVESAQFAEFSTWCEKGSNDKGYAIQTGAAKVEDLSASIEQFDADIGKISHDIAALAGTVSEKDQAHSEAKKLRAQEHADFQKADAELTDAIDQCVRAAVVLRREGLNGSPGSAAKLKAAMTQIANTLSTVMDAVAIDSEDKRKLSALIESSTKDDDDFLGREAPKAAAYESHSHAIIDTLAELKVRAEQERADLRRDEMNKKHNFEMLSQSLTDETNTLNRDLSNNQGTLATKKEGRGTASGDLSATQKNLDEDKQFLGDLKQQCQAKSQEFSERQKNRAEEKSVLSKGIEILSESNFQAASGRRLNKFVQVKSSVRRDVREQVAELLQAAASRLNSVGLAQLATRTRSGDDPFGKVRGLIGQMIDRLMSQQAEEADHKAYCDEETAKSKSKREKFSDRVDTLTTRVDSAAAGIAKLKEEVSDLSQQTAEMDSAMAEATSLRQKESAEYKAAMTDYKTGQDALSKAISVLQDYFSSKGEALVQAPEFGSPIFSGSYEKRVDGASGIIGILEVAASDMARMEAEAQVSESASQRAFTKMKNENQVNRAMKQTAIKNKESEVARVTNLVADLKSDRTGSQSELDAVLEYLAKLKNQCEHKPMTFAERSSRRKQEIESLQEALRILESEAAPAFLQRIRKH